MNRIKFKALVSCAIVLILAAIAFYFFYRPWALSWGATRHEVSRTMPGDDLVADPTFNATRAVAIHAPPQSVWPWLVQMGYRRAGFYSYDRLDNANVPSAENIISKYQVLKVGDTIPMSRVLNATVVTLVPNQLLVMVFRAGRTTWSWTWVLQDEGVNGTRMITRLRVGERRVFPKLMLDAVEIIMMRKCMLGIKRRAESAQHV